MAWPWNLGLGTFNVIETGTIQKLGYGFLFIFHSNYITLSCIISEIKRFFSYPFALDGDTPMHGGPIEILPYPLVCKRMMYGWKENSMLTNCLAACAHLSITVSEIKRDIGRKSSFFSYPLAFDALVRGVPLRRSSWNFARSSPDA